jgi:hypothetical protein
VNSSVWISISIIAICSCDLNVFNKSDYQSESRYSHHTPDNWFQKWLEWKQNWVVTTGVRTDWIGNCIGSWQLVSKFVGLEKRCNNGKGQPFFFNLHSGGWSRNWVHSARRPFTGLLYLPQVNVRMENLVEWMAGETEVIGEDLSRRHFVHHKSHLTRPGIEPGPPRWEASD